MDRVCDSPKYPPKALVALCQVKLIQGHEVKKVNFETLVLDGAMHVFRSDFRQKRER